ncbi:multiple sugar transport system substrate-binding protein [Fontibacillus phaseoli]|uniref:Multiple sugar transport system substrate-binding protein n=1 Tax=Fontibacillus phaseoli TaxID=1416533 RepID=A0A369BBU0_9BACL|nr:ABC transporter substrate-binding protein [Fontibacillus phaseoli]RCX18993.1 multiple sugar transport system substrate-binding protein [Fontibacillus phaseoli]
MLKRKALLLIMTIILVLINLNGCINKETPESNKPILIKVLTWNEKEFFERYGNVFLATHPNFDLETILIPEYLKPGEDLNQAIERIIINESPDVVSLNMEFYDYLREKRLLEPLNPFIKRDNLDLSTYTPSVIEFLQDNQNDLFGLTPTFTGKAIYYNKKLFADNNIPEPTDLMTWDDIFELAQRFPKSLNNNNTPVYGFYHKDMANSFLFGLSIGEGSGVTLYNNNTFTLNTEAWNNIFDNVVQCVETKSCYEAKDTNQGNVITNNSNMDIQSYPFLAGNIAMAIDDSTLYKLMINNDKYKNLEWGVVSYPVSSEYPDTGNMIDINEIFSINSSSAQIKESWEFISYINGDSYAKLIQRINPYELPVRENTIENSDPQMLAFYKVLHVNSNLTNKLRKLPKKVLSKIDESSKKYMTEIYNKNMSIQEALEAIENELQLTINEELKN